MRTPTEHVSRDGTVTYKVRFRQAGVQTSETFRRKADALTFAAILDGGGIQAARAWLAARAAQAEVPTFAEWFNAYVDQLTGVTVRTRADYRAMARRYLSSLDAIPLNLLTRSHVAAIVNQLESDGRSGKTIKNVVHMLASCLAGAVDEGHLRKNPARGLRLPGRSVGDTEPRFLEPDQFATLLSHIPEQYQPLVTFLVGTGLRWSEATALEGRHVSLERGTVRVEQAWKRGEGATGWHIGPPKSAKSRRTVNAAVLALRAVAPLLRGPNDLVFTTANGKPIRHNNFHHRVWRPAAKASGIVPEPRLHDLRHTHASWLISDGVPLEAVQDQLGHESILTTRAIYGHLQPAVGVAVGRSASATLARALPDAMQLGVGGRDLEAAGGSDEAADLDGVGADVRGGGDGREGTPAQPKHVGRPGPVGTPSDDPRCGQ